MTDTQHPLASIADLLGAVAELREAEALLIAEENHREAAQVLRHLSVTMNTVPLELVDRLAAAAAHVSGNSMAMLILKMARDIGGDVPLGLYRDATGFVEMLLAVAAGSAETKTDAMTDASRQLH